ncbi:hypothetical protein ACOMHN_004397 [Nucella lapillus]
MERKHGYPIETLKGKHAKKTRHTIHAASPQSIRKKGFGRVKFELSITETQQQRSRKVKRNQEHAHEIKAAAFTSSLVGNGRDSNFPVAAM